MTRWWDDWGSNVSSQICKWLVSMGEGVPKNQSCSECAKTHYSGIKKSFFCNHQDRQPDRRQVALLLRDGITKNKSD